MEYSEDHYPKGSIGKLPEPGPENPLLSIVIPVYKSELILRSLCERLVSVLVGSYEILLVVDASPDRCWNIAVELSETNRNIKPVLLRKNVGQENAIMAGLRLAQGEYVVIMDDDLQHAPEDIPALLKSIETSGADVVYLNFTSKKQSAWKNAGSWLNGKVAEWIIQRPKDIYLSPFKIIRKETVEEMTKYQGPYPYVDGLLWRITSNVHQIPGAHFARASGKGNTGFFRSVQTALNFCTTFSILPLRLFTIAGFAVSAFSILFGTTLIARHFLGVAEPEGWSSLIVAISFLGGVNLLGIGIVGEYIGRVYMNVNAKPQYAIQEMRNGKKTKPYDN